ncbi:MAG: TRAP transporter permease [Burkholderiaceae bacterium]|nr:TRAP transporter permease [Burkholderiaceae bacterium]
MTTQAESKAETRLELTESRLANVWWRIAEAIALCFALFHLYTAMFGTMEGMRQRVVHIGFALVLTFLVRPRGAGWKKARPSVVDIVWIIGCVVASVYLFVEDKNLDARLGLVYKSDVVLGGFFVLAVLEATRRLSGWALPIVSGATILYAFFGPYLPLPIAHKGFDVNDVIVTLFLTTEGIFGVALAVSSTFIILFIILGAVLNQSGAATFFTDLAYGLFGRVRGGPAKVAVVGSSLFGMISGSAIANVTGTGVMTIPLMKKTGFDARFAGAVEAVASAGGQFMPPIMASAAFIIAEILQISYLEVAAAALIPGLLYYAGLFVAVDLRAARYGLKGLTRDLLPRVGQVLVNGGYLLLVPITLVYMLAGPKYSPMKAAVYTISVNVALFLIREVLRRPREQIQVLLPAIIAFHALVYGINEGWGAWPALGCYGAGLALIALWSHLSPHPVSTFLWGFVERVAAALRSGAHGALEVAACCACAGIIIGMLMLTGLGLRLSGLLVDIAGNNLLLLLVLTMISSLILGMGVPTVGAYVVLAVLVAPALIQMGIEPLSAHLFIFYFGVISTITPPVCLGAFAAAAISGANPMRTGLTALRLGLAGFIVPFVMVYNPELIMKGSWYGIVAVTLTALVGVAALATGLEGFWRRPLAWWGRALLVAAGLTLIKPGLASDLVGGILIAVVFAVQIRGSKRAVDYPTPSQGAGK